MSLRKLVGATILAGSLLSATTVFADDGKIHDVNININGVPVESSANHQMEGNGAVYVDVAAYTKLVGVTYKFDQEGKTVTVNEKELKAHVIDGVPTVPVRELAVATGSERIHWHQEFTTVSVLDLPVGVIKVTETVPGMGEHWLNPKAPEIIYGVQDGHLVFTETSITKADFDEGKSFTNIKFLDGAPSLPQNHSDIEFIEGHEGLETPHYDIHNYYVTHEEHLSYAPDQHDDEQK